MPGPPPAGSQFLLASSTTAHQVAAGAGGPAGRLSIALPRAGTEQYAILGTGNRQLSSCVPGGLPVCDSPAHLRPLHRLCRQAATGLTSSLLCRSAGMLPLRTCLLWGSSVPSALFCMQAATCSPGIHWSDLSMLLENLGPRRHRWQHLLAPVSMSHAFCLVPAGMPPPAAPGAMPFGPYAGALPPRPGYGAPIPPGPVPYDARAGYGAMPPPGFVQGGWQQQQMCVPDGWLL